MDGLRTLHIDAERNWGGGERQVAGLCTYLKEHGHGVVIACRSGSKLDIWVRDNGFDRRHADMKSSVDIASVYRLRSIIKSEKPDIVHLHTSRAHVLGSAAARIAGVPVVVATRRMDEPVRMKWPNTSAYGKWTTAVVAISGAVRDVLVECGVDPEKIRVIESGTDVDRFVEAKPDACILDSLGVPQGVPVVCTSAVLDARKGIEYLLRAAAILKSNCLPFHLLIAGDGPLKQELVELAAALGVPASFVGFSSDVPVLLASSDVFVMPSIKEGLGVAVLEAMAAGKPVVASAVGGLKESVVDNETGFSVAPGDVEAIAGAIERLLRNREMAAKFGQAGRQRVSERYSITSMAQKNENLYYELLDTRSALTRKV